MRRQPPPNLQPLKALVVDDDPVIRDMMLDILECEGYEAQTARNGREALDAMSGSESYLVFLDLLMPVMSGKDVCQALERYPQIRARHILVLMSALDSMDVAKTLNVDMVMPKPFVVEDVLEATNRWMAPPSR